MRISDWSSDVCSSDLAAPYEHGHRRAGAAAAGEGLADTGPNHAQTDAVAGDDLRETDVGRLRECGRLLQRTAVALHRAVVNVSHLDHGVRVAGRHLAEAQPGVLVERNVVLVARRVEAHEPDRRWLEPRHAHGDAVAPVAKRFHCVGAGGAVEVERSAVRSEEHTSELQSLMRISDAVFCLKKTTETRH